MQIEIKRDHYDLIMERFVEKAKCYLLGTTLVSGNVEYNIVEVEFYECSEEHPDTFTHCHPQQQTSNEWYFHRGSKKSDSKYRGGTFKGVDITFSPNKDAFCGMIIRSLQNISTGETIEGPCRCVNKILEDTKSSSIDELVTKIDLNVETKDDLYVKKKDITLKKHILCGPRIGLRAKTEDQKEYVDRHYRFVLDGAKVKKQKKSLVPL